MRNRPRFFLDIDALIDAALFEASYGFRAYMLALFQGTVMMSSPIFTEFEEVLMRPRFDRYLGRDERQLTLALVRRAVSWHEPWCHYSVCRDPSDDKFIDLAVCCGAAQIVTRDTDLLSIGPVNGIGIIDAKAFVEEMSRSN